MPIRLSPGERRATLPLNYGGEIARPPIRLRIRPAPRSTMKSALAILLTAILPCFPHHASAGFGDKEIVFSEAEVQAA